MPEDIDEISVKMSLTTEDFVKDVDKAITEAISKAEDFEQRIAELHSALKQLGEGAEVVFSAAATGESLDDVAERLIRTGEIADKTAEQLVAEAEAASALLDEISQQTIDHITEIAEASGVIVTDEAKAGLKEYAEIMARASETGEEFVDKMNQMSPAIIKAAKSAQPANIAFEETIEHLEHMGIAVPFTELERFKQALIAEAQAADAAGASTEELAIRLEDMKQKFIKSKMEVKETGGFVQEFKQNLGGLVKGLAPVAIAIAAVTKAYQAVSQFVRESIQVALEAAESQRLLAAAVREHSRAVGELSPTIAEANEFANQLSETYNRTRNEMREVVTQSLLLTRDLKLSRKETEELAESALVMSETMGVDAVSALRTFTNFLNTGYTSGLQRLGFSIDEQSLQVEALRRGYITLGEELDEQTMRMVGLEIINERASDLQRDMADGQESIDERAEAVNVRLETQKEILGETLIPAWIALKEAIADVVEIFVGTFVDAAERGNVVFRAITANVMALVDTLALVPRTGEMAGFDFGEVFKERQQVRMTEQAEELFGLDLTTPQAAQFKNTINALKAIAREAESAAGGLAEFSDEVIGAATEAAPKLEKAAQRLVDGLLRIDQRLEQTMLNIERQFSDRRLKLQMNLAKNLAAINRQAAESRLKLQLDFNIQEEREEQDHLLRMSRLEEDFLINLDDAVRNRDALAVLQLQRQHNLDKKRANEDNRNKKQRRREDFDLELAEIERQRQIRIALAQAEFAERMAMLAEEQRLREERAREDAERQRRLLEQQQAEKMRVLLTGLQKELNLTDEQLKDMFRLMDAYYGSEGWFVQLVSNYYDWLAQQGDIGVPSEGEPRPRGGRPSDRRIPRSFQRGGSFIATSPQLIEVGESSPEMVSITPLSGATGRPRGEGAGGERSGTVEVNIGLDDGLVGEIVDQSMNEMADVVISINRGGRKT